MKVNFQNNVWDQNVDTLKQEFTRETIAKHTGLTVAQVNYRIKRLGYSVRAYRRGETDEARRLLARIDSGLELCRKLKRSIRLTLKPIKPKKLRKLQYQLQA